MDKMSETGFRFTKRFFHRRPPLSPVLNPNIARVLFVWRPVCQCPLLVLCNVIRRVIGHACIVHEIVRTDLITPCYPNRGMRNGLSEKGQLSAR